SEQISVIAVEKWIVRRLPSLNSLTYRGERTDQLLCRDHNSRDCSASNIAGSQQDAGALVTLGGQCGLRQILVPEFDSQITIDQPSNHSANKNRARGCEWQIHADREGKRRNAAHFQHNRDHGAEENERPWKFAAEN